jgi:hypothetical protein
LHLSLLKIKIIMRNWLIISILLFTFVACKTAQTNQQNTTTNAPNIPTIPNKTPTTTPPKWSANDFDLTDNKRITFLDSLFAAKAILVDTTDQFFEHITTTDMMIQMKMGYDAGLSKAALMDDFKQFLRQDVTTFFSSERKMMEDIFKTLYNSVATINPNIFPTRLNLIRTAAKHYGNGVYYTRENCIIIPKDALDTINISGLEETMAHELFHVYSRLNPDKKTKLYQLIGFSKLDMPLTVPEPLKSRILLNPDGTDYAYTITLTLADGKKTKAVPIIYSSESKYMAGSKPQFFNYLKFDLFPIEKEGKGYKVIANADATSSISIPDTDYFKQIKQNTNYIIHPDEILADNFMLLINSQKDTAVTSQLNAEGKKLLEDMKGILKDKVVKN